MSNEDEARLAIAHAHSLAAIDVDAIGMALGQWVGRGNWAEFPQEWRDRQGVRALMELDAAITHLTTARDRLAQAVTPAAMVSGTVILPDGTRIELSRMEACPLASGDAHVGGWTTAKCTDPNAATVTIQVVDGPTVTDAHPVHAYVEVKGYGRADGLRYLSFQLSAEEAAPLLAHEPLKPNDEF